MKQRLIALASTHGRTIVLATLVLALLLVGGAGEAAAHNPAGFEVPGCSNGAGAVAHQNPNCHG